MFPTIEYMIAQGVPQETIVLLLMLPIVATVIAFARQVIGIKGFGIYIPLIVSLAFLATGLKYGLALFITVLLVGTLTRLLVKRFRLLYLPRMAVVLTAVALGILLLLLAGAYTDRQGLIATSIFAILIMGTLVEKFITVQIEQGARGAIILTSETLFLSIVCYWIASWPWLQNQVLVYPLWFVLGVIIINIFLGRWTGLRLSEYWRFREVIKRVELPEKK
ncbi:MAG: hypothetical protein COS49_01485 [Candidatus Portnoybacteria bacterium CG03_land_8_20_14_0_80_41_10]|uniref:7 transmembrane helices usually fused to an inactive transglutaminase domain-containing protein n=1 Tax=Candidatus Portnoybacteria bacterium CG03_land_8_20_14_0_80_41_10 TaxID=1974808 RepID=A0A2M7BUM9_9BACT|nr:MAG: hypothetical protein COS49_01485 [Candidatus Portnoybacteria bacterium CG03_land_8_20_14_0_80_41_10]